MNNIKIFCDEQANHRPRLARVVEKGDKYGLNWCITHEQDAPLVEFYDPLYDHTDLGQFVIRYYVWTIMEADEALVLDTGVTGWTIGGPTMKRVREWLTEYHT